MVRMIRYLDNETPRWEALVSGLLELQYFEAQIVLKTPAYIFRSIAAPGDGGYNNGSN